MDNKGVILAVVLSVLYVISVQAETTSINYGDFTGVTVQYTNVTEESSTDDVPLYGTPTIDGDSLEFDELSFFASTPDDFSGGGDITDGKLAGKLEAFDLYYVDTIHFEEWGDVTIAGSGGSLTSATVTNKIYIKVKEINGFSVPDMTFDPIDMVFDVSDGDWNLADDGTTINQDWSGDLTVDVTSELRDFYITDEYADLYGANPMLEQLLATGFVTEVDFTLENQLLAIAEVGSVSHIAKKETDGLRVTSAPEPATLLLLGLGGLVLRRRKA